MKKSLHLYFAAVIVFFALSAKSQNLFPEGNFENGVSNWAIKWNSNTAGTFTVTDVAAEGTKAALIDVTKTNTDLTKVVLTGPQFTGIDDRSSFRISTMMKSNVVPNEIKIQYVTKDAAGTNRFNNSPKDANDEFFKLTTEYRNYKWIASTNKQGFGSAAEIRFQCAKYVAQYFIDNIKIEKIEGIEDGGFEEGDLNYGYTPTVNAVAGANATLTLDNSSAFSGSNALKVEVTATDDTASHVNVAAITRYYPDFGKNYEFSFYAKGTGANDSVFANINYYNGNNDFISSKSVGFKMTDAYAQYKADFTLPADSLFSVKFRLDFGKQVSTIYADDLTVTQIPFTSSHRISGLKLKCYPNPATSHLIIEGAEPGGFIEMINIAGITVKMLKAESSKITLNTSDLSQGIYFVKAGERSAKVIIK